MKILVAPDSFKGSLSAAEAAAAMARGIRQVIPEAEILQKPLSDGGEGLVESLVQASKGKIIEETVTGPLGAPVKASWGIMGDGRTAVIEMAAASGLPLVPEDKRNPMHTTTYGTGELIRAALDKYCSKIIIGIGGSATNDGGAGMARALGVKFLDAQGEELPPGGGALGNLESIDISGLDPRLQGTEIMVACDVDNPLTGPRGASRVYGPQKGADDWAVALLDRALQHYATVIAATMGINVEDHPGAGAAGGLGAGLMAFLGGRLTPGIDLVIDAVGLREALHNCRLVLTGEGKLDYQSAFGKVPVGVSRLARDAGVPVIAFAGIVSEDAGILHQEGINAYFSIINKPMDLSEAMNNTAAMLESSVAEVIRLWKLTGGDL